MDPSTPHGAVVLGVFAGVLASAFLFITGKLFFRVFLPWYREQMFEGVDLEGVWLQERSGPNGEVYYTELQLEQKAHRIFGTLTVRKAGNSPAPYTVFFSAEGYTWEGFVVVTMKSKSRRNLSFIVSLLKVEDRGERLVGHSVFRGRPGDEARTEPTSLARQSDA